MDSLGSILRAGSYHDILDEMKGIICAVALLAACGGDDSGVSGDSNNNGSADAPGGIRRHFQARLQELNGGSIALGHPLGCSGVRISATLLHEMKKRSARFGAAAMCVGVGQGAAIIYERI